MLDTVSGIFHREGVSFTYPSGRMLITCRPMINDELWRMLESLTLCSEIAISRS